MTEAADDNRVAVMVWRGKEYTLRYTFSIVRRLRAEGINLPRLFRNIMADPEAAVDAGDEIAAVLAFLLREAGADVSPEDVWRGTLSDRQFSKQALALFYWVGSQHFATGATVPKPEAQTPTNTTTSPST